MKKKFIGLLIFTALCAVSAFAHPLGNFSINQYSRLEVETSNIKIRSVLDMAEIPTFQAKSEIDTDKDGNFSEAELNAYAEKVTPQYLSNLFLTIDSKPLELREVSKTIINKRRRGKSSDFDDQMGFNCRLTATDAVSKINFENKNYVDRLGWDEMVVNRTSGVNVFNSTAYGSSITDELNAYPEESLNAPLAERSAEFSLTSGAVPADAKPLQNRDGHKTAAVQKDQLAELINVPEITLSIAILRFAFGFRFRRDARDVARTRKNRRRCVSRRQSRNTETRDLSRFDRYDHAHARSFRARFDNTFRIAIYFAGNSDAVSRFRFRSASFFHRRNDVQRTSVHRVGLEKADGITVIRTTNTHIRTMMNIITTTITHTTVYRIRTAVRRTRICRPKNVTWKSLLALGISGGLLPCPSALVLMLSAISVGRIGYGLVLTIVFSFGLAATLTAVGLAFLYVGKAFGGSRIAESRIIKALPVFSSFIIACVGAVICYNSFG